MKITIVGAGVSGLIAAKVLEDNGFYPTIIEASGRAGGRLKTDVVDGFTLDHGFQVLLSAYPAVQKYIDFVDLKCKSFSPGALIFMNGTQKTIGDPIRDLSLLFPTMLSGIGNFSDKLKILKLNKRLKSKRVEEIFQTPEKTTKEYLEDFGFSNDIIGKFFAPFFTGIFLETDLKTSSRMFEFVFKMFAEGLALLPKDGIEAIPKQLVKGLKSTSFLFDTKVAKIGENVIILEDGTEVRSDFSIDATDAKGLVSKGQPRSINWKSCVNLYFTTRQKVIKKSLIGLIADQNSLINNISYPDSLHAKIPSSSNDEAFNLLSVTVVKEHALSDAQLVEEVKSELELFCGISQVEFLKLYQIKKALPQISDLKYAKTPQETQSSETLFLAGDAELNGSLNAAILSGEAAALGVLAQINKTNDGS